MARSSNDITTEAHASMILMIPTFKTKTTLVHFVQSAQGTTHLVLLDLMSPDLRHTHRI